MTLNTFRKALIVAHDYDSHITLGGGEPTIHPHFEKILLESIANSTESNVHVITNGKHIRRALLLAELARKEIIGAELSTDQYHEEIDPVVMDAFEGRYRDNEKIRGRMILAGRFIKTMFLDKDSVPQDEICCCEDWIVQPNGTIKQCGCEESPIIGDVNNDIEQKYLNTTYMCCRSKEFSAQLMCA